MLIRLQTWLEETHGPGFELLRHFLAGFFDSEMAATTGEWRKVVIGVFAMLLSAGILVLKTYSLRYSYELYVQSGAYQTERVVFPVLKKDATGRTVQLYRKWVRGDLLSFIAVAMALTGLLTLLQWKSLFPGVRDCMVLAALPVSLRQVFLAKFTALLLLFTAFVLALSLPLAASFHAVTSGPLQENPSAFVNLAGNFCATAGACTFVFFSLLALQGVLLHILPGGWFTRASLAAQAGLFIATLGALPLLQHQPADAAWSPPVWFLGLREAIVTGPWEAARGAVLAMTAPPLAALLAYLLSYHRYRRLLLEAPPERGAHSSGAGSWLLERCIADPREQAVFAFIGKTLARSGSHRLILLAYAGLALGWVIGAALDSARPSLRDQGMYGLLAVAAPLALAMLAVNGLRCVFTLPAALPANWLFRSLDRDGRRTWLAAVERFVVWCGIVPVFLAGLPAAAAILGWPRAAAATVLGLLGALLWFEAMFRQWRKIPFTCSYLPGRQPVWLTVMRYCLAIPLLAPAGKLILHSSTNPAAFAALFTLLVIARHILRARRRQRWEQCALLYEEAPEAAVLTLDL